MQILFPGAAGRRSMAEGSGKGEAEAPHAAFRQRVEHARQQIDRRHVHRKSSLSNVVVHSLADFDPTALRVLCVVNGLVHVMYGYTTWRNQWGQTTHLLGWHSASMFLSFGLSAAMLVVLCVPGRIRLYVARYYQELCALFMVLLVCQIGLLLVATDQPRQIVAAVTKPSTLPYDCRHWSTGPGPSLS